MDSIEKKRLHLVAAVLIMPKEMPIKSGAIPCEFD